MKLRHTTDHRSLTELEDQALIEGSLAGNPLAWAALIERYERLIYSIPIRYGLSESQAADIFQDVCLILLEKLDQINNAERIAAWLAITTRRECWRLARMQGSAGALDPEPVLEQQPSALAAPDAVVEQWEAYTALHRAFASLDARCRQLLERLYFATPPATYASVAEELDMPVGSIGPTRARCLAKLRHLMGGTRYRVKQ